MSDEKKAISVIAVLVIVIVTCFFLLRGKEPLAVTNQTRLDQLQTEIESWVTTHGVPPDALSDLGLPAESTQDYLGQEFHYEVAEDGTVTLITYGAGDEPGGRMFKRDMQISFKPEKGADTASPSPE